ncbi:MAG TPA: type II toxin-antitoxin system death-on-curing family toxin [Gemmatimonadaceae bacterium]|nr:type II toxin-antitoxin system death-on-curing family toxin [Gemmatimonadaceae bacterium]
MKYPRWITAHELQLIHVRQLELFGGADAVVDENIVDSALHKPQQLKAYVPDSDIAALAADYLCGFAQKQGLVDGNKRTALGATLVFLRLNGHALTVPKAELLAFVLAIARNDLDQAAATTWLRERITIVA